MLKSWISLLVVAVLCASTASYADEPANDCDGPDFAKRIPACTALIETPDTDALRRAAAFANRAIVYSVREEFEAAIQDFDAAIQLFPNFSIALNNRAWAYFKWGKLQQADRDVDRALFYDPVSAEALDTRAHVSQWMGIPPAAIRAYEMAMAYGGSHMVAVYQCGLKIRRLYSGAVDGAVSAELRTALQQCVAQASACDPLPPDENCGANF